MHFLFLVLKFCRLVVENATRNLLRTLLTAWGTMMMVFVVTGIWSILEFLQKETAERTSNIKAIVSERWRLPSQMPSSYANTLIEGAAREPGDIRPQDYMTWTFYGGSLSKEIRSFEDALFAFVMEPEKLLTMMEELDSLKGEEKAKFEEAVERLKQNPQGIILGQSRLQTLNKRIGDRFTLYGINYKDIDLEVEVVGAFPPGRYDSSAVMNKEYFNKALFDAYPLTHNGQAHPLADRSLNLVWLKVPDTASFTQLAEQVMNSPYYSNPAVKVETASSGISTFLEAYRDIFWAMRWLLSPAIFVTLSLIISNAISISVRERRMEFAVMKVLGFRPFQILFLVMGEALLIGTVAGGVSAWGFYFVVNEVFGGIPFPIAFFPAFTISPWAPVWGLAIGAGTALVGSFIPAFNACTVRVAEVFGRVA